MSKPHHHVAVMITRKDGSVFLASGGMGNAPAVWAKCNHRYAVAHKRDLRRAGLNAKVVPVLYTAPVIL